MRPAPRSRARATAVALPVLAALAVLTGCASGSSGPPTSSTPPPSCFVLPEEAATGLARSEIRRAEAPGDAPTVVLGLSEPVDFERAPVPAHPGEAFLFRTLYEPLVQMDCEGRIHPGLASSWRVEDGGRRWIFTLREGARFWDGTLVTPRSVAESWQRAEASGLSPWGSVRPVSLNAVGERRLQVVLDDDQDEAAAIFAGAGLSVVGNASVGGLPTGTGPYRVVERSGGADGSLVLEPVAPDSRLPPIHVQAAEGGDLRDLLDGAADLVITGDPATLAYARLRPDLRSLPLPWNGVYALAIPPGERPSVPPAFLESLARDVVREEARPAGGGGCPVVAGIRAEGDGILMAGRDGAVSAGAAPSVRATPTDGRRILYPVGDPIARSIAERIVALAASSPARRSPEVDQALRALGLAGTSASLVATPVEPFEGAGVANGQAARLIRIPRRTVESCPSGASVERGVHAVPLVDTRLRMLVRSAGIPVAVDGWSTPFIVGGR